MSAATAESVSPLILELAAEEPDGLGLWVLAQPEPLEPKPNEDD